MREISYIASADGLAGWELSGFFVGWPQPPNNEQRLHVLEVASEVVIAREEDGTVVGFITAITDGVFAAYIPLLEVLPAFQGQGIDRTLVERMLSRLRDCYMIDLVLQFAGDLCAYQVPGGTFTMRFTGNNVVSVPDGSGGNFLQGTFDLTILEATGIFRHFAGGHNHMLDSLHFLAPGNGSGGADEYCVCF